VLPVRAAAAASTDGKRAVLSVNLSFSFGLHLGETSAFDTALIPNGATARLDGATVSLLGHDEGGQMVLGRLSDLGLNGALTRAACLFARAAARSKS